MAYAKKTLANLQQSLADRHDSGVLPTSSVTLAYWTRLLNRGLAYCADKLKLETSDTITIASGTGALPDDFISINRVFSGDQEYTQISKDDVENQTGYTYWITGSHFGGFYLNTETDGDYTVYYAYRPAEMVNTTDVCVIPDPEAVSAFAYGMLRKSETDPIEDADASLQECEDRLNSLIMAQNINDKLEGFHI